jgi:hypothetical protein
MAYRRKGINDWSYLFCSLEQCSRIVGGGGGGGGQNGKTDAEMLSLCGICEVFSSPNNGLTNSSG